MMDELVNRVAEKTGLSPEQARSAVDAVLGLLKQRLPEPFAGMIGNLVEGQSSAAGAGAESGGSGLVGEAESLLGNMFGSKKEGEN